MVVIAGIALQIMACLRIRLLPMLHIAEQITAMVAPVADFRVIKVGNPINSVTMVIAPASHFG